jgi:hypothetical protein
MKTRRASVVEAHEIYAKYHRHHEGEDLIFGVDDDEAGIASEDLGGRDHKPAGRNFKMFHKVMKTGVIYATSRARSKGFCPENLKEWAK